MGKLDGKIAIVTGGNSGIGKATAKRFLNEGATVVIACRRADENKKTVDEFSSLGEISAIEADLTKQEDCKMVVEEVIKKYGRIDVLVNNAGIADKHKPINKCEEEWYDYVCKIDQYSIYWMCKYALVHMEKVGKGHIINISSIGSQGVAGISYSAAKAAVNGMTKNIAILYAKTDITCNAVAPGPTPTPLNAPEAAATFDAEFAAECGKHIDITLPEAQDYDQAATICFLASEDARAITGQIIYVDHGTSLY
ncbi:MAG: SDR family oxidoreductase [Eubacterium sp.]|nr:SDR family oxidoreductase [Eubacterium sp.]